MSSAASVNHALTGYAAGRVSAEQLVAVIAAAYYGDGARGTKDGLKSLMEIIERAHPGVVELTASDEGPGFAVRLAERPFPKRYEAEFRQAVQALLDTGVPAAARPAPPSATVASRPGLFARIVSILRRVFRG